MSVDLVCFLFVFIYFIYLIYLNLFERLGMGMGGTIHPVYVCELTSPAFRGALAASGVSLILTLTFTNLKEQGR